MTIYGRPCDGLDEAREASLRAAGRGVVIAERLIVQPLAADKSRAFVIYRAELVDSEYPGSSEVFRVDITPSPIPTDDSQQLIAELEARIVSERPTWA